MCLQEYTVHVSQKDMQLMYVFIVDEACENLGAVMAALSDALSNLPRHACVALVTFYDKVTIYDLRSERPHRLTAVAGVRLGDIMEATRAGAPLEKYKAGIAAAMGSVVSARKYSGASAGSTAMLKALHGVIDMLSESSCVAAARIMLVLQSSAVAPATVDVKAVADRACNDWHISRCPREWGYRQRQAMGELAATTGGRLSAFKADKEGGRLLGETVKSLVALSYGGACEMRLRTSLSMRVESLSGHAMRQSNEDNLWHMAGCTSMTTFAIELTHEYPSGFLDVGALPSMQVAVEYTKLVTRRASRHFGRVVRRLRIFTIRADICRSPSGVLRRRMRSPRLPSSFGESSRQTSPVVGDNLSRTGSFLMRLGFLYRDCSRGEGRTIQRDDKAYTRRQTRYLPANFSAAGIKHLEILMRLVYGFLYSGLLRAPEDERGISRQNVQVCNARAPRGLAIIALVHRPRQ